MSGKEFSDANNGININESHAFTPLYCIYKTIHVKLNLLKKQEEQLSEAAGGDTQGNGRLQHKIPLAGAQNAHSEWKLTLDLSSFWSDKWNDNNIQEAGQKVASAFSRITQDFDGTEIAMYDFGEVLDAWDILVELTSIQTVQEWELLKKEAPSWIEIPPVVHFNKIMNKLYQFSDIHRILIKTSSQILNHRQFLEV